MIEPLAKARRSRLNVQDSKLLKVLENLGAWKSVKLLMEFVFQHVANSERIFSRASQIHTDPDPDGVVDDMFAEARVVPYLILKGFKNIEYNRREGLDFSAEFDNQTYNIEVAYIRGPTFKTQKPVFVNEATSAPIYQLEAKKLINRLITICSAKEKQAFKHGGDSSNTIIFVISDLDEMYEPWLNHDEFQGSTQYKVSFFQENFPRSYFVLEPYTSLLIVL